MARTLNNKYFSLLERSLKGSDELQSYTSRNAGSMLVMCSKADAARPIVAVTFTSDHGRARTLVTRRHSDAEPALFQALTNTDNAPYAVVITNLTDFVDDPRCDLSWDAPHRMGCIKISIVPEEEINGDGRCINQSNVFAPSQSCVVESDVRHDNCGLVLRGAVTEAGAALSVAADDVTAAAADGGRRRGTRFHINVSATHDFPALRALFEAGVVWRCCDVFTRRIAAANGKPADVVPMNWGMSRGRSQSKGVKGVSRRRSQSKGMSRGRSQSKGSKGGSKGRSQSKGMSMGRSQSKGSGDLFPQDDVEEEDDNDDDDRRRSDVTDAQSLAAQAATSGVDTSRRIVIHVHKCNLEFVRPPADQRATLALSIWPNLPAYDALPLDDAMALAAAQRAQLVDNAAAVLSAMIKPDRFVSEECVVCWAAPATHVCTQCGHQCVCSACVDTLVANNKHKTCIICRQRVVAIVDAAVLDSTTEPKKNVAKVAAPAAPVMPQKRRLVVVDDDVSVKRRK